MNIDNLSPSVRFANIFTYFPSNNSFVAGYDYRLFYIIDGSVLLKFKDFEFLLSKHSVAVIPPATFYKLVSTDEKSIEILCLNFDNSKGEGRPTDTVPPCSEDDFNPEYVFEKNIIDEFKVPIVVNDFGVGKDLAFDIVKEFESKSLGWISKMNSQLASLLVILARNNIRGNIKKETCIISEVREYLQKNLSEDIDTETLGRLFHYHPNYLNRIFKENCGITLHAYIISIRIEDAKQLLTSSNMSLEKIAFRCGFKTLSHFSQCFKKCCGIAPSSYRNNSEKITI